MSQPDTPLGPLRGRDGEPAFDDAWQAQALAIADLMVQSGAISAEEWAQTLGRKLRDSAGAGDPDDTEAYYRAVLSALEELLAGSGAAPANDVLTREQEWRRAYLNTPHGQPVELRAAHEPRLDGDVEEHHR